MAEKALLKPCPVGDNSRDGQTSLWTTRSPTFIGTTLLCGTISSRLGIMKRHSHLSPSIITLRFREVTRARLYRTLCPTTQRASRQLLDRSEVAIDETVTRTREWVKLSLLKTLIQRQGTYDTIQIRRGKKSSTPWWRRRSQRCNCSRWRTDWIS